MHALDGAAIWNMDMHTRERAADVDMHTRERAADVRCEFISELPLKVMGAYWKVSRNACQRTANACQWAMQELHECAHVTYTIIHIHKLMLVLPFSRLAHTMRIPFTSFGHSVCSTKGLGESPVCFFQMGDCHSLRCVCIFKASDSSVVVKAFI